jgi:hypothetical protein
MKNLFLASLLAVCHPVCSQFYYNDIVSTTGITRLMVHYKTNKVLTVTGTATDAYGVRNNNFYEMQEVKENGRVLKISRLDEAGRMNTVYQFDDNGQLASREDSANGVKDITVYRYDNAGRILSVFNKAVDKENEFNDSEEHLWSYNDTGRPVRMWKIMNGKDSLVYEFSPDEKGNVADEYLTRNGVRYDPLYYYYYDDKNRLTDIARYNKIAKKILPDLIFTFDEQNNIIQKLATVPGAGTGYITLRYGIDEKGLKTKEVIFNRLKQKTGAIDFSYTFSN